MVGQVGFVSNNHETKQMKLMKMRPLMHVNKTKFVRNSSRGYYHMTSIEKNKTYQLKKSIIDTYRHLGVFIQRFDTGGPFKFKFTACRN